MSETKARWQRATTKKQPGSAILAEPGRISVVGILPMTREILIHEGTANAILGGAAFANNQIRERHL